jgi:phage terminase large subunit
VLSPAAFQEQLLKRRLWAKQHEICEAIATRRSVSIKGCHGSGKTFTVSGLVPYELLAYDESIVLTIAPTLRQVKLMWNEIESAIKAVPSRMPERTTTGWRFSDKRYAQGFSSSKGVNAQGFHGRRVLIIADEAIGISSDVWDAVEGIRAAGDVRLVKLCNPTVPQGAPYDDFTRLRGTTACITISAFDTPNLVGLTMESLLQLSEEDLDYAPFPWLTRRRWVKEMYVKWGPTNPRFMSRVLGEFPTQASDAVFHLDWIEKAGLPYDDESFRADLRHHAHKLCIQVGLDIAGPGDDETAICARLGTYVLAQNAWSKADPLDEVRAFLSTLQRYLPDVPIVIMADTVGVGYHFARALARDGYSVWEFVAGHAPLDPVMFANAKAEAYWRTRELMRDGFLRGVLDEDCQAQLSDVRYRERVNGTIEIEHKDEARARGSRSPDRAEALVMAFQKIVPREQTVVFGERVQISRY